MNKIHRLKNALKPLLSCLLYLALALLFGGLAAIIHAWIGAAL